MRRFSQRSRPPTGVKAHLRSVRSPEVADLERWSAPASFSLYLQLLVGPEGEPGEESFGLTLCTPDRLALQASKEGVTDGRHHFVVDRYDYAQFDRYIRRRVASCEGATWDEVAAQLSRLGRWEFEDAE